MTHFSKRPSMCDFFHASADKSAVQFRFQSFLVACLQHLWREFCELERARSFHGRAFSGFLSGFQRQSVECFSVACFALKSQQSVLFLFSLTTKFFCTQPEAWKSEGKASQQLELVISGPETHRDGASFNRLTNNFTQFYQKCTCNHPSRRLRRVEKK